MKSEHAVVGIEIPMSVTEEQQDCPFRGHAIIAGYGVPGRVVAELMATRKIPYCVIELNPATVDRCATIGVHMVAGDVRQEKMLRQAGVEHAAVLVLAIPNDAAVLEAVAVARRINPMLFILARCHFISAGMEAHRRGANEVVIEEQVVGQEFVRLFDQGIAPLPASFGEDLELPNPALLTMSAKSPQPE